MHFKSSDIMIEKLKNLLLTFIFMSLLSTIGGCASTTLKAPYSPAYTEQRALVESTIKSIKPKPILILYFKDKREEISDPKLIYKRVSLESQSLSEYLSNALLKDLNLIGLNATLGNNKKLGIKGIETGKYIVDDKIKLVLNIDVNKCTSGFDTRSGFWMGTVIPYSTFDFQITVWDTDKSKIVYSKRLVKQIIGVETTAATFESMVTKLINEDLTVVNVEIAEILAGF